MKSIICLSLMLNFLFSSDLSFKEQKEIIIKEMSIDFYKGKNFYCDSNSNREIVNNKEWELLNDKFISDSDKKYFYLYECTN